MKFAFAGAIGIALIVTAAVPARAHITEIKVEAVEPFAQGQSFGNTGAYLRIHGIAKGELDPKARENAVIADIDKTPRNERGLVAYETDFFMLRPADPRKGSGILFYDVTNRGRKFVLQWLDEGPANNDPKDVKDAGIGFSLGRGYTIVWSGWDPDAPTKNFGMTARVPVATDNGAPIIKRIRDEIQIGTRGPLDVEVARLSYPSAVTDTAQAKLMVRDRERDARTEIPTDQWEFVDKQSIRLKPAGTKFTPVKIYEVWYPATQPKVTGIGYAATRDLVSFLRYEKADSHGTPNPALADGGDPASAPRYALGFGVSQSGRYLRHHIELGMNHDEKGRRVFDGVLAHISGAGKVSENYEFSMANRTATQHEDRFYPENWFPFSAAKTTDPMSGKSGALLRNDGSDPLWIETNTSTEYWQKGASLLTIDPGTLQDVVLPPNARAYLIAGTQHGGRAFLRADMGLCVNPRNPHNPAPALRALIVALEDWVTKGIAPPPSRVPSIADHTAVEASAVKMPMVKGFTVAPGDNPITAPVDWIDPPTQDGKIYATRVTAVNADGNEIAGIRLPDITVPLGTYTGWNVYKAQPSELCDRDGSYIAFTKTKAEREQNGDPRLSIEERYANRDAYIAKIKAAADALVADRLLLPGDAASYVKAAQASDRFSQ